MTLKLKTKQSKDQTAWNAPTPTQANPHAGPSKEEKAACEKEPSEIALFLLQRNWLAWSWTSGKQPKINGELSVGINPRTAVLQTHPAAPVLMRALLQDLDHEERTGGTVSPNIP